MVDKIVKPGEQSRKPWFLGSQNTWVSTQILISKGFWLPNKNSWNVVCSVEMFVFPASFFWGEARKFLDMMNRIRLNISGRTDFFQVIFDHRFWCRKISHRPPGSSKPSTLHKVCQATPSKTHSNGTIVYLPLDVSYKLTKCRYIHHTYIIFHHMYPYIGKVFTASLKAPNKNI